MLRLPPPLWALIYLLLAVGLSWLLGWPRMASDIGVPWGVALVVLGLAGPLWAANLFRRAGTEIQPTSQANKALITSGPYRYTRNPMYSGLVEITFGIALWTRLWPLFLVPIAVFLTANFVHIPFEEAKMRRQFGDAFDAYARRVRRWI